MKNLILKITLFFLILTITLPVSGQFLKVDGTKIVDAEGKEVIWRGIGLGGWMLQEGYMLRVPGPQYVIEANITDLIGKERKEEFYEAWYANHMRKIDVDSMAAWGYNMIRLPMHYKLFTPPIEEEPVKGENTWREKGFQMVDELIEWCRPNSIYLILDLHAAPGGQGENADINDYDPSKPSLWESEENQKKTIALWQKLAERYKDEPVIAAYDMINEPNWGFEDHENDLNGCSETQNTLLWAFQKELTQAIREIDQNHIIVIEGNCWGNNYRGLPELWDDNLVVSFHKYWNENQVKNIQHILDMRSSRQVPVWLGESGENGNAWFTDCIALLEEHHIGWSWWPFKKLGFNNPVQIKVAPGYQAITEYWRGRGPRPDSEAAYQALMQYTENLKFENNIQHPDVVDAMIRQPFSEETVPFADHLVGATNSSIIQATDFDMGRNGIAYFDTDAANTTGRPGGAGWNLGRTYRNDGIDIQPGTDKAPNTNGYSVGWTKASEWMQYTIEVQAGGKYELQIRYATENPSAIGLELDGKMLKKKIKLPATGGDEIWTTRSVGKIKLPKGTHQLKVKILADGVNLGYYKLNR